MSISPINKAYKRQNNGEKDAQMKCAKNEISIMILNIQCAMSEDESNHQKDRDDGPDGFVRGGEEHN
jgi:hypothetical protein